jgi:hypothetical protein
MRSRAPSLVLLLGLLVGGGCVGDDPTPPADTTSSSSSTSSSGGGTSGGTSGGTTSSSGDGGNCDPGAKRCIDGTTLGACGVTEKCAIECSEAGSAHCTEIEPAAPITKADLRVGGAVPLEISNTGAPIVLNTDNGAIDGIRTANGDPTAKEMISGIGFQRIGKVGVFTVKSFKVNTGATLIARGGSAFALAATETIEVIGLIDARGYNAAGVLCGTTNTTPNLDTAYVAGPGGFPGGDRTVNQGDAPGAGGGKGVAFPTPGNSRGAGGGGFGGAGGAGGAKTSEVVIQNGGPSVPLPSPIHGGFGGGASGPANGKSGGGGGGAVQLVAQGSITIGGGANPGGINVGGCGGESAQFGTNGSAGGSGGAIFLQSPITVMKDNGVLAANGGGGGTQNTGRAEAGKLSAMFAIGSGASTYGKGGNGAPTDLTGSPASYVGEAGMGNAAGGGSGGGGAGRIRIENRSGSVVVPSASIISPAIAVGGAAVTTVGTLAIK